MRINRDELGDVIPFGETLGVDYIYDKISENNLKTATVYSNQKLTFVELDMESENYGKQVVPCILKHLVPFSSVCGCEGFAECSIGPTVGYLPRECKLKDSLSFSELLNARDAYFVSKYLKSVEEIELKSNIIEAYFNLTGINLSKEKRNVLTKKIGKN